MLMSMIYWSRCWWWQSPSCGWWGRAGRWRQTQQRRRESTGHSCVRIKNTWWGFFCSTMCKIGSDLFCKRGKSGKKWFKGKPNLQWEKFSIDCTEALLDSTSAHFAPKFGFGWNWFGQNCVSNITFNQHHHRLFQISTHGLAFTDT